LDKAYDTSLSLLAAHMMIELEFSHDLNATSLSEMLLVDPLYTAHTVRELIKTGLLKKSVSKNDKRSSIITRLPKAAPLMLDYDKRAEASILRLCSVLSPEETKALRSSLLDMINHFGFFAPHERSFEHPLRAPIRGMTRILRLLEVRPHYSELNIVNWHILSEIYNAKSTISTDRLHSELKIAYERVSYALRNLSKSKLIKMHPAKRDARFSEYQLTALGEATLKKTEQNFIKYIKAKLSSLPISRLRSVVFLMEKVVRSQSSPSLTTPLAKVLVDEIDLSQARVLYAKEWIAGNLEVSIFPAKLCLESNFCIGVLLGREIVAMAEYHANSNQLIRKVILSSLNQTLRETILSLLAK
jgi:DNA-binding MarR family transcriptional regulator